MPEELRLYLKERFGVQGPLSPGRFEAELAKWVGSPAKRAPLLKAWRAYLEGGGREAVRSFYREVLKVPKGEALVYGMHLPFLEFYAKELPPRVEGRVLEVGPFTGALVGFLQRKRPDLEWHALEGVEEAAEVGKKKVPEVVWHLGWAEEAELPPFDTLLLLSVFPEGFVEQDLESRLAPEAFWKRFAFFERLPLFLRLLRPGGLLVYGHGPFLGKSPEGVEEGLRRLGFDRVERVGEGEYFLVFARRPEALAWAFWEEGVEEPWEEPEPLLAGGVDLEEVRALLEAGNHKEVLARLPEEAAGEAAYLRGKALYALSRHAEAEEALRRALSEEAEDLRALVLVELGEYERARGRLETLAARGGRYRLALGRVYLAQGRYADALREFVESGLPEAEFYTREALERITERMRRFAREGEWAEVSRRAEFVEDLSPRLLTREMLRLGLRAALFQGLFARAERYARRLADLDEPEGFLGLALSALRLRTPLAYRGEDLKAVEPYLTEALSRAEIPEASLLLGVLRKREGRLDQALHLLEGAAHHGEGEVAGMAYHHLAEVKRALGRPLKEVLGDHKRAHALRAYPAPYLFRLAQEALEGGEEVLARELLSRARDRGLEAVAEEDLLGLLGLLEKLEGPWAAFSLLYQALGRTPNPPLELLALAYRLSRSFRESPEAEAVRGQYLAALYGAGRMAEAEALLLAELRDYPQALEVLFDLAEHYEAQGDWRRAAEHWQKALEVALYREKDLALAREILRNLLFLRPHDESLTLYLDELKAVGEGLKALGEEAPRLPESPGDLLEEDFPRFHGEHLLVVGGHTQLRSRLVPFLEGRGLRVDWYDADTVGVGKEALRRIQSRLEKAHGLMIVSSYVGHDLSEPVRLEAERLGVPVHVIPGRARGATGFLRALKAFAPEILKKALKGVQ
ncbi:Tetratricopeptide repeat-containing protein [Thermus arciformis]|uniref:Tetratricopeptide repeat-containing protein n=1 Tax=Thermus arciformis TaxID=482827 RepID=A0A1G7CJ07_9DEIN|nr:tetratricopeptide repeat protein [Thermus arciformis]SDE39332.1 Tetratricopeptide repeat-containing protein [Thermus arciformis]